MELLRLGINALLNPQAILWLIFGIIFGVIFGALPGVSATMAIVLCISFTYAMKPVVAIAFLSAVYCAAITGGSITAILFKIPGTPGNAATVLDGYPMVMRGEAGKALSISLTCSALGGLASAIIMFLLTRPLIKLALKFGSPEMFAVCALALGIMVFLDEEHKLNTFASAIIGLWLGTIGLDYFANVPRFSFGTTTLLNGVSVLPFMLGLFASVEVFNQIETPSDKKLYSPENQAKISKLVSFKELLELKWTILRSGLVGTVIGILPGAGATIASWMSYTFEKKINKHPERLGTGDPHGVAASETANNAATGGAMVPLLSMGIPGSNAAAMMMTALAIHGVQMGPLLLKAQPEFLSATFTSMAFANILMIFVSLVVAKVFSKVLKIPYYILGTFIMLLAAAGCYAYQNNMADVYIMVFAGIIGYFFKKYNFNASALVLGLVLGPMTEEHLRRGFALCHDSLYEFFFGHPIVLGIFIVLIVLYSTYVVKAIKNRRNKKLKKN